MNEDKISPNTNIIDEDPFNEDEVRRKFRAMPRQTCWKLARVASWKLE